jgi:archaellum component FlaC
LLIYSSKSNVKTSQDFKRRIEMKLYDIADKYRDLQFLVDELQQEEMVNPDNIVDGAWDRLQAAIDSVEDDFKSKIDNITKIIENTELDRIKLEMEIERLEKRIKRTKKLVENLKNCAKRLMLQMDTKKIKTSLFDLSIQLDPEEVIIFDEKLIPEQYFYNQPRVLKSKIKKDLQNGMVVPGAELVRGESLKIR